MIGTFFKSELSNAKNAKKWDKYVLLWDYEYEALKNGIQLLVWNGLNGKGEELFNGTKLASADFIQFPSFKAFLKKDLK